LLEQASQSAITPLVLTFGADGVCVAVQYGLGEPIRLGTPRRESLFQLVPALRARDSVASWDREACGEEQRSYLTRHRARLVALRGKVEA
jgi:hypothetical protein